MAIIVVIIIGIIIYQEVQRKAKYIKKQQEREFIKQDADEKLAKLKKTLFYSDVVKRIQHEGTNFIRIEYWGVEIRPGAGLSFDDYGCNLHSNDILVNMDNKKRIAEEINRLVNYQYTIEEDYNSYIMYKRSR